MRILTRFLLFALLFQALLAAGCAKKAPSALDAEYVDAQEIKLKIRELADQMLATTDNSLLTGLVAMPSSFVNLNNKTQTSSLGNLFAESLIYEFNQRGFPVREYRLTDNIDIVLGQGDFALLRKGFVSTKGKWSAVIVGTYHHDQGATFVNARLVRAWDGMVLRTGQLVLVNNALVNRLSQPVISPIMQAQSMKPTLGLSSGTLHIKPAPWKSSAQVPKGPGLYGVQY